MTIKRNEISRIMGDAQTDAFEKIDNRRGKTLPSEVEAALQSEFGLGDAWVEWWTESGEDYS